MGAAGTGAPGRRPVAVAGRGRRGFLFERRRARASVRPVSVDATAARVDGRRRRLVFRGRRDRAAARRGRASGATASSVAGDWLREAAFVFFFFFFFFFLGAAPASASS